MAHKIELFKFIIGLFIRLFIGFPSAKSISRNGSGPGLYGVS